MRHLNAKLILTTVAITGVIGAGVAVAADPPTWCWRRAARPDG